MSIQESGGAPNRYAPAGEANATAFNFGDWRHWEQISRGSAGYCAIAGVSGGGFIPFGAGGFASTRFGTFAIGSIGMAECAPGVAQPAWSDYGELHFRAGTKAPSGFLYEGTIRSEVAGGVAEPNPYAMNGDGVAPLVSGHRVGNCKDTGTGPASFAYDIVNLSDKEGCGFNVGLNICDKAINAIRHTVTTVIGGRLTTVVQLVRHAVAMAMGHAVTWMVPGGALGPLIMSLVDTPGQGWQVKFLNGGIALCGPDGVGRFVIQGEGTPDLYGLAPAAMSFPRGARSITTNKEILVLIDGEFYALATRKLGKNA